MKNVFTPIAETLVTALLVAGAPFMFFFGPPSILIFAYSILPSALQQCVWYTFPPDMLDVSFKMQTLLAGIMVFAGLFVFAGFWGAYPQYRRRGVIAVLLLLGWSIWAILEVGGGISRRLGSF